MAASNYREVLLTVGPPQQRQLRLSVLAAASLAEMEGAVLLHLSALDSRDGEDGPSPTADALLPLEYLDQTFSEWCVLTAAALPGLPPAVRMRTAAAAAAAAAGSCGIRESRVGSPQGSESQAPRGLAGCWAGDGQAGIGSGGGSRRQLLGGDGEAGSGGSRSLLQALAEEDLTALPLAAMWLEERLKTVSLATVCVVAVGFLAWYLQSALQMLLVAALLAVLLDPLVDFLSSPISPSFPRLRLPRVVAIIITLALVLALGAVALLLIYNALTEFIGRASEFRAVWEAGLDKFKDRWKALTIGQYLDIDAAAAGLQASMEDSSFVQTQLTGAFSYVGSILGRMVACMVIWIFLVITPHSAEAAPRPPTPHTPHAPHPDGISCVPAPPPPRPAAHPPVPAYAPPAASFGTGAGAGPAVLHTGGCLSSISPPPGGIGLPGAPRAGGWAAEAGRSRHCYPSTPLAVPPLALAAPPTKLSAGASQPRPSAEQQTRTYLRWKAAIALGKALTCGLIYALTGLPLWPVFALLVFWLHWVPIVGSAIAIVMPLPLAVVDPSVTWLALWLMVGLTAAVHMLVDNLIDQVVMARAMVLHPVAIIVGVCAANIVWGVVGMILSVPMLATLKTKLASTAHPYAQACAALLEGNWMKVAALSEGVEHPGHPGGRVRGGAARRHNGACRPPGRLPAWRRLWLLLSCSCREACGGPCGRAGYSNVNKEELAKLREISADVPEVAEMTEIDIALYPGERTSRDESNHLASQAASSVLHSQGGAT